MLIAYPARIQKHAGATLTHMSMAKVEASRLMIFLDSTAVCAVMIGTVAYLNYKVYAIFNEYLSCITKYSKTFFFYEVKNNE